ncbi:uncharacterized protein LOC135217685 [Macrobrachium nipponense]|uniref:uncharacterized protein LOC135217685 n=1 Tax=Macrobrachium nipponense TaxID=159736 RepID=UPI0030C88DBB
MVSSVLPGDICKCESASSTRRGKTCSHDCLVSEGSSPCYSYEHLYKECPKDKNYKICSECSSHDHTYRECKENTKKCVNCNQQHRTLAAKCPVRKALIKRKIQEIKANRYATSTTNNGTSYAKVTASNTGNCQANANNIQNNISRIQEETRITITTNLAIKLGLRQEGFYPSVINNILADNNLPTIHFSEETVNMIASTMKRNKRQENRTNKAEDLQATQDIPQDMQDCTQYEENTAESSEDDSSSDEDFIPGNEPNLDSNSPILPSGRISNLQETQHQLTEEIQASLLSFSDFSSSPILQNPQGSTSASKNITPRKDISIEEA